MERNVHDILNLYNPNDPLDHAWTIPSPWYFDQAIARLEQDKRVLRRPGRWSGAWDQGAEKGKNFHGGHLAVNRSSWLAAKMARCARFTTSAGIMPPRWSPKPQGCAKQFRCRYHG